METGRMSEGTGGSPGVSSSLSAKWEIQLVLLAESYSPSRAPKPPSGAQKPCFFPSFFQILTGVAEGRPMAPEPGPKSGRFHPVKSGSEQHPVHDPSGQHREQAGDHERPRKQKDHDPAVLAHLMTMRLPHPERQHGKRHDHQEMDLP